MRRRACGCRSRCSTRTSWTRVCGGWRARCARCAARCATARRCRCRNLPRMSSLDSLVHRERPPAGEPEGALVLLHGRATDENDLFPLLDILDPDRRLAGYTLRGPLNLPPGGWHCYELAGIPTPDPTTFTRTFERVSAWLDSLAEEIGVGFGREASQILEEAGLDVTWRESPMMHGVDPAYLAELEAWLREAVT